MRKPTRPAPALPAPPVAVIEAQLYCPGSLTAPTLRDGKPCCPVCKQMFKWQEMVDQIKHVPEH